MHLPWKSSTDSTQYNMLLSRHNQSLLPFKYNPNSGGKQPQIKVADIYNRAWIWQQWPLYCRKQQMNHNQEFKCWVYAVSSSKHSKMAS